MRIIAKSQNMAPNDVLSIVDKGILAEIKTTDPKPVFKVFCIGHEGDSYPNLIGGGKTKIKYFQNAVMSIYDKLKLKTPAVEGHVEGTNSLEGREIIGIVAGKTIDNSTGIMQVLAPVYIKPEYRNKDLDCASFEASIEFGIDSLGRAIADSVQEISAIALGKLSQFLKPAFEGATLLGQFQAFVKENPISEEKEEEKMPIKVEDVKEALRKGEIKLEDIYSQQELVTLPSVKSIVENREKEIGAEKERYAKLYDDVRLENTQLQDKVKTYEREKANSSLTELITAEFTNRKFNDRQKAYMDLAIKSFKPSDATKAKEELAQFVDSELAKYRIIVPEDNNNNNNNNSTNRNLPPDTNNNTNSNSDGPGVENKYLDPKFNDLIPT